MTPMDYLRRVRLEHAHRYLVTADPGRQTVTAIAYDRPRFASASRLPGHDHRKAYGVGRGDPLRGLRLRPAADHLTAPATRRSLAG